MSTMTRESSMMGKKGLERINKSMNKISAMLGIKPSDDDSDDSKKEAFINNANSEETSDNSAKRLLRSMNSAEAGVTSPPTLATHSHADGDSYTKPAKTKTSAGAVVANLAASVDNSVSKLTKSFRNVSDKHCGAEDPEEGHAKGMVNADGTTTEYVSAEKSQLMPKWKSYLVWAILAALAVLGIIAAIDGTKLNQLLRDAHDKRDSNNDKNVSVAFIGNSYMYVNDIPRVMEAISDGRISQNSVLNTAAGLGSLLKQGNGMYQLWQTENALDNSTSVQFREQMQNYGVSEDYVLYDWGKCTVPQLLDGFDNYLSYRNKNGVYFNVGTNPCFKDPYYMTILQQRDMAETEYFDYVVLNDQTRRMADMSAREDSLDALAQAYSVLIKTSRAIPIVVDTHAFPFEEGEYEISVNQTIDGEEVEIFVGNDTGAFTSAIYVGLYEYLDILEHNLPSRQKPIIAKIGMTYLAIHDDNKDMWKKLFAGNSVHASPYGSYLFSVVLHCAIYGHLPKPVQTEIDIQDLFNESRAMFYGANETLAFPTISEANYLRMWARRVQLNDYVPKSMSLPVPLEYPDEAEANATEGDEYDKYDGEGNGQ